MQVRRVQQVLRVALLARQEAPEVLVQPGLWVLEVLDLPALEARDLPAFQAQRVPQGLTAS